MIMLHPSRYRYMSVEGLRRANWHRVMQGRILLGMIIATPIVCALAVWLR